MQAHPVSDGIHWVGAIDWNLRDFHGYETPRGTTYNAYLVVGADKIALVDTVKTPFVPELLERVAERRAARQDRLHRRQPRRARPQQRAAARAWRRCRNAKVVASAGGVRGIAEYHGPDLEVDAGRRRRRHRPRRQDAAVHADADGALARLDVHLLPRGLHAHAQRRVRSAPRLLGALRRRGRPRPRDRGAHRPTTPTSSCRSPRRSARRSPRSSSSGWACDIIAPSHGVIWRARERARGLSTPTTAAPPATRTTSSSSRTRTMWGSTDVLAREIADGAAEAGVDVHLFDLAETPLAHITPHLLDAARCFSAARRCTTACSTASAALPAVHRRAQAQGQARRASSAATAGRAGRPSRCAAGSRRSASSCRARFHRASSSRYPTTSTPRAHGAARWASWSWPRAKRSST